MYTLFISLCFVYFCSEFEQGKALTDALLLEVKALWNSLQKITIQPHWLHHCMISIKTNQFLNIRYNSTYKCFNVAIM